MDCTNSNAIPEDFVEIPDSDASEAELFSRALNLMSGLSYLHSALPQELSSGLSSQHLEQWIEQTARECGVEGHGLGRMLVAQMALVHHQIGTLITRFSNAEPELLIPWSSAVARLMGEFRRGYFALCKLQDARQRTQQRRSKKPVTKAKSNGRNGSRSFVARQQLNAAN